MIDTNLHQRKVGETEDESDSRLFADVDSNWLEVCIVQPNETEVEHYKRFLEYELSNEWRLYMIQRRDWINEDQDSFENRIRNIKNVRQMLRCRVSELTFSKLCQVEPDKSKSGDCYWAFNSFIVNDPLASDIINRRDGEKTATFEKRFKLFLTNYKRIVKSYEEMIIDECERVDSDKTAKEWKDRVDGILLQHSDFINPLRYDWVTKSNETNTQYGNRMKKFLDVQIECSVAIETECLNSDRAKARAKEEDKIAIKREEEERITTELKEKIDNKNHNSLLTGLTGCGIVLIGLWGYLNSGIFGMITMLAICSLLIGIIHISLAKTHIEKIDGVDTKVKTYPGFINCFSFFKKTIWGTFKISGKILKAAGLL